MVGRFFQEQWVRQKLTFSSEIGKRVIPVENVLFVPGLAGSLLSVSKIAERGFNVSFQSRKCLIVKEGEVIALGKRKKNGLYVVN